MAIPRAQLDTWANQGATTAAVTTHESIRYALETAGTSTVKGRGIEIFLQGSYRNATNIYADSDVDVVVLLPDVYTRDPTRLVGLQRAAEQRDFVAGSPPAYSWWNLKPGVLASLQAYYGPGDITAGSKAFKVAGGNGRLSADVVPAVSHRLYTSYGITLAVGPTYVEGMSFWDQGLRQVVNYPKQHITNGENKNALLRTGGNYKPIVRMFKNARQRLVERGLLGPAIAPSYFVECLLYNVPDHLFVANRQVAMDGIRQWLWNANKNPFLCQNELMPLIGNVPEQWTMPNADAFIVMIDFMWNNWPV